MKIGDLEARVRADVLDASAAVSALVWLDPVVNFHQLAVLVDPCLVLNAVVRAELHDVDVVR